MDNTLCCYYNALWILPYRAGSAERSCSITATARATRWRASSKLWSRVSSCYRELYSWTTASVGTILKIENRSISIDFRAENRDFDFCQSIFFQKYFLKKNIQPGIKCSQYFIILLHNGQYNNVNFHRYHCTFRQIDWKLDKRIKSNGVTELWWHVTWSTSACQSIGHIQWCILHSIS